MVGMFRDRVRGRRCLRRRMWLWMLDCQVVKVDEVLEYKEFREDCDEM